MKEQLAIAQDLKCNNYRYNDSDEEEGSEIKRKRHFRLQFALKRYKKNGKNKYAKLPYQIGKKTSNSSNSYVRNLKQVPY